MSQKPQHLEFLSGILVKKQALSSLASSLEVQFMHSTNSLAKSGVDRYQKLSIMPNHVRTNNQPNFVMLFHLNIIIIITVTIQTKGKKVMSECWFQKDKNMC